jgi:hypothetical protein
MCMCLVFVAAGAVEQYLEVFSDRLSRCLAGSTVA